MQGKESHSLCPESPEKVVIRHEIYPIYTPVETVKVCPEWIGRTTSMFPNTKPTVVASDILKQIAMQTQKKYFTWQKESARNEWWNARRANVNAQVEMKQAMGINYHGHFFIYKVDSNSQMILQHLNKNENSMWVFWHGQRIPHMQILILAIKSSWHECPCC